MHRTEIEVRQQHSEALTNGEFYMLFAEGGGRSQLDIPHGNLAEKEAERLTRELRRPMFALKVVRKFELTLAPVKQTPS